MFTSASTRAASVYKRVAAETSVQGADPHQLVDLLFDALLQSLASARGAMARGDVIAKGQAIGKAVRIIEEGLKAGLNVRAGGDLALNLQAIYEYSIRRLTLANLRNDVSILEEADRLIRPIREAWVEIGPQVARGARA